MCPSRGSHHWRNQPQDTAVQRSYLLRNRGGRRASPTYEDYPSSGSRTESWHAEEGHYEDNERDSRASHSMSQGSQRRSSPSHGDYDRRNRMESRSREYYTDGAGPSGYNTLQRGPTDPEEPWLRRAASPKVKESSSRRSTSPPLIFKGSLAPPKSPPPPPPRRTEPRAEYLAVSLQPSAPLEDPTSSRKLIVLDLNGSLLLRSAHKPRHHSSHRGGPQKGQPTNSRWDPYADPTQPRPLRTVHPRPYLGAFKAYILHEQTKKWLDTMIWSSAQPHSVADMVDKCFQDRRDELRAVWARDTLGLSGDEYHRKTQTLKDLEKPWSELPLPHTATPNSNIQPIAHNTSNPSTEHATSSSSKSPSQTQRIHSAQTTLLIDDSPLKAALQPWNHLCIREYVQEMRRWDLGVVDWEVARAKAREAREAKEEVEKEAERRREVEARAPESSTSTLSLNRPTVEGEAMPSQAQEIEAAAAEDSAEKPTKKRKLKRLVKKEAVQRAKEEKEREALLAMADIEDGEEIDVEEALAKLEAKMRYDETLLAVVGVLDRIKHESNVAGWMRAGGLLDIELLEGAVEDTKASEGQASDSPGGSPIPAKRRRVGSFPQPEDKDGQPEMGIDVEARSSTPPMPPPSSQPTSLADRSSPAPEPMDDRAVEEQSSTGVPLESDVHSSLPTANGDAHKTLSPSLWYEKPEVMAYWAERGRQALKELGIEVESGIVPAPGGLQP